MVAVKTYSKEELSKMTVVQIRQVLRDRGMKGIWTASAKKNKLIRAYFEGHSDEPTAGDLLDSRGVIALRGLAEALAEMLMESIERRKPRP